MISTKFNKNRSPAIRRLRTHLSTLNKIDTKLFEIVNTLPHPSLLNRAMEWLAKLMNRGDGWLFAVLVVEFLSRAPKHSTDLRFLRRMAVIVWLATFTVEVPLKFLFRRPRPFIQLAHARLVGSRPRNFSFPSGHTASAFACVWLLRNRFPRWRWLHFATALIIAFNRVYLGAHFPGDTLAGAFSGVGLAAIYERLFHLRK